MDYLNFRWLFGDTDEVGRLALVFHLFQALAGHCWLLLDAT